MDTTGATLDRIRELACGIAGALQEGEPELDMLEELADDAARMTELLNEVLYGPDGDN